MSAYPSLLSVQRQQLHPHSAYLSTVSCSQQLPNWL
nr:MAG TPA: hypothetical protein [Caudoviricetes sp.]